MKMNEVADLMKANSLASVKLDANGNVQEAIISPQFVFGQPRPEHTPVTTNPASETTKETDPWPDLEGMQPRGNRA